MFMDLRVNKKMVCGLIWLFVLGYGCSSSSVPRFDASKAFSSIVEQCQMGPRFPGSVGHEKARTYLVNRLSGYSDLVKTQEFTYRDEERKVTLQLTNIIASFYPEKKERILLCAHWDTRPVADHDPDSSLRSQPIPGANDGASGTAILLEVARIVSEEKPLWGVDLIFFDGEDWGPESQLDKFCLGSKYFAKNKGSYQPYLGILLDMVADQDLKLYKEAFSCTYAPQVVDLIWTRAHNLGFSCFNDTIMYFIYDDQLPLLEAGIPCIDLIDYDYPWYHTLSDTPDKCSPKSLQIMGDLMMDILYHKFALPKTSKP
jgi:glutaminyl-peptide cyclotransferase